MRIPLPLSPHRPWLLSLLPAIRASQESAAACVERRNSLSATEVVAFCLSNPLCCSEVPSPQRSPSLPACLTAGDHHFCAGSRRVREARGRRSPAHRAHVPLGKPLSPGPGGSRHQQQAALLRTSAFPAWTLPLVRAPCAFLEGCCPNSSSTRSAECGATSCRARGERGKPASPSTMYDSRRKKWGCLLRGAHPNPVCQRCCFAR